MTTRADAQKWFLQWSSSAFGLSTTDGRPWGDGTAMALRESATSGTTDPWDEDCEVVPLIGGYETLCQIADTLEQAIAEAGAIANPGSGHVYITDWRLNPLRDMSRGNTWKSSPWTNTQIPALDQTAVGLILRLMQVGVNVRVLVWLPVTAMRMKGMGTHVDEHFYLSEIVAAEAARLSTPGRGIVGLDSRVADPFTATHHQKMCVIRVGAVDVAFVGGVDWAFTRRDAPADPTATGPGIYHYDPADLSDVTKPPPQFLNGDWQSGTTQPVPFDPAVPSSHRWPNQSGVVYDAAANASRPGTSDSDLPANVYGTTQQIWHDQHFKLLGPIVQDDRAAIRRTLVGCGRPARARPVRLLALDRRPGDLRAEGRGLRQQRHHRAPDAPARDLDRQLLCPDVANDSAAQEAEDRNALARRVHDHGRDLARDHAGDAAHLALRPVLLQPAACSALEPEAHRQPEPPRDRRSAAFRGLELPRPDPPAEARAQRPRLGPKDGAPGVRPRRGLQHLAPGPQPGHLRARQGQDVRRPAGRDRLGQSQPRSFTCDTELDCAVLDTAVVELHQQRLWKCLFPSSAWPLTSPRTGNWGKTFFDKFATAAAKTDAFLIEDPWDTETFTTNTHVVTHHNARAEDFDETVTTITVTPPVVPTKPAATPREQSYREDFRTSANAGNRIDLQGQKESETPIVDMNALIEPSSLDLKVERVTSGKAGDPGPAGRLDEIVYLIEGVAGSGKTFPFRKR